MVLILALVPYISNQDSSIGEEEKFQYPQLEYIPEVEEFQEMEDHTEPMGKSLVFQTQNYHAIV